MHWRSAAGLIAATALSLMTSLAPAFEDVQYPDLKGQWIRIGSGDFDPSKPRGLGQRAPLTPEYQAILEWSLADQAAGGQGNDPTITCIPGGMPRAMIITQPMQFVVTPETTYMMFELHMMLRRVYTDGRDWPAQITPTFMGYSIGKWVDEDGDGRYDALLIETRGIKLPHVYENSGIPFHQDGQAVIKERIYLDKGNPDRLHNEITVIDNALSRPWTVTRSARRELKRILWSEYACTEDNHHVMIGEENYVVSGDGFLMPAKKNQKPPDLRYFDQP